MSGKDVMVPEGAGADAALAERWGADAGARFIMQQAGMLGS